MRTGGRAAASGGPAWSEWAVTENHRDPQDGRELGSPKPGSGQGKPSVSRGSDRTGRGRDTACERWEAGGGREERKKQARRERTATRAAAEGPEADGTALCSWPQERLEGRRRGPGEGRQVSKGRGAPGGGAAGL